jgi:hypothetical protein
VKRILLPGGHFGFTVWHKENAAWAADMRTAFDSLPFEAPLPDPVPMAIHGKLEWTDPEGVRKELVDHGFVNVKVEVTEQIVRVKDAEDYLKSFGMMKTWMVNTHWSEESKEKGKDMLDDHILSHLKEKYNGEGWDMTWKAIIATCQKPSS